MRGHGWWVYVLALLAVLGAGVVGLALGFGIGHATCNDEPDALLRCLDEEFLGTMLGAAVGLFAGMVCAWVWFARH